mmetsp:Transcript_750/g.421  ORF Transcript_750/g.421 Transcript_750/m.421 type:complete len:142 (+) Transcript_750:155-580(+)
MNSASNLQPDHTVTMGGGPMHEEEKLGTTTDPKLDGTVGNSTGLLGSGIGSNPYSSSMYSPYGGGMYGGMGGMGMYRPGMYGGMYGGGMYGGMGGMGMMGNSQSHLEKMNMYVFQLCEIAQMVEMNAHGLYSFFSLLKNIS